MDHMQRLSREHPNLSLVTNGAVMRELKSSTARQSIANNHAVVDSSNLTVTSSLESSATASSVVSDNFAAGASDSSSVNTSVPVLQPETKVDKTESLLGKRKSSESSSSSGGLLAQFSESKSRILGFTSRNKQTDNKAPDELQSDSLKKLKGNVFFFS